MSEVMPLIPLRGLTVFPNMVIHFDIGREKSIVALERAMVMNQTVFLASQMDVETDLPTSKDIYDVGTVVKIKQMLRLPGNNIRVLVDGQYRAKCIDYVQEVPYFLVSIEGIEDPKVDIKPNLAALMRTAVGKYKEYSDKHQGQNSDVLVGMEDIKEPGKLADLIAANMELKVPDAQSILSCLDPAERLLGVVDLLNRENEILDIEANISSKVKSSMNKNQREYYLREQMRAIHQELGEEEDPEEEVSAWKKTLKDLNLSEVITRKIEKEIDRFAKMMPASQEASVSRSYIEWILELPWNKSTKDDLDLIHAQQILDEDHYGLEKVKERIIEYLAVKSLTDDNKAPVLCLVGPPGVGKTSIAKSVARAVGKEFVHMSLGGVRDEAEIRGHRRTYVGAIPGRVMSIIKECDTNNPVFLFDEVDKIGADFHGDPASALLEVLDPVQNKEFVDHYLEVPFDLSGVLFITTANTTDTIPRPLLDRMEVIELSGYTPQEKYQIATKYLVDKQLKASGLKKQNISFNKTAITEIINSYTRESGVRGLEKEIGSVCRKVARKYVEGDKEKKTITAANLEDYLGKKKYFYDKLLGKNEVGVATGLAWTVVGGETLFIEVAILEGTGQLQLTGQLGDVMQESAKAAVSYIRANAEKLGIEKDFYKKYDIHIHIPEGATPKDGPSAGVTMCTAVISALTKRKIRKDVAMTGEITLRGKILPVGGIKEKVLAAHRMGIKKVLLPEECKSALDELPQVAKDEVEFVLINTVDDALKEALV